MLSIREQGGDSCPWTAVALLCLQRSEGACWDGAGEVARTRPMGAAGFWLFPAELEGKTRTELWIWVSANPEGVSLTQKVAGLGRPWSWYGEFATGGAC